MVAVASGNTLTRAARPTLGASLGGAVALLLAACGGSAGAAIEEPADEPAPEVTVQRAQPTAPAEASSPGEVAADPGAEQSSLPISVPPTLTPQPPPEPAPLPSAEIESSRPLLPPAPAEVVVQPGDCRFEYLGEYVYCESPGWPNTVETDAPDLVTCMQRCLEREDCTAVTDYLWLGQQDPHLGCWLFVSTCDAPAFDQILGEEDLGRTYRRGCAAPAQL